MKFSSYFPKMLVIWFCYLVTCWWLTYYFTVWIHETRPDEAFLVRFSWITTFLFSPLWAWSAYLFAFIDSKEQKALKEKSRS